MPSTLTAQLLSELVRGAPAAADAYAPPGPAPQGDAPRHRPSGHHSPRDHSPCDHAAPGPTVLADRPDGTVVALGSVVAKAHPPGTDPDELAARMRVAGHPLLGGILLPPLPSDPPRVSRAACRLSDGRLATLWPRGTAVDPDDEDAVPWEEAGALLARMHAVPPAELGRLPLMRGPLKAARGMARMREALARQPVGEPPRPPARPPSPDLAESPDERLDETLRQAARTVERAWSAIPAWCRAECPPPPQARALCHGDFHLGQLVRHPAAGGGWRLIDVDDLGVGDPAWDLARPAAWFAAGLLPAPVWERFLYAYTSAGGRDDGDPWPWLDAPARALTAQTAALGIAKASAARRPLDEAQQACVDACFRIAATVPATVPATGT